MIRYSGGVSVDLLLYDGHGEILPKGLHAEVQPSQVSQSSSMCFRCQLQLCGLPSQNTEPTLRKTTGIYRIGALQDRRTTLDEASDAKGPQRS